MSEHIETPDATQLELITEGLKEESTPTCHRLMQIPYRRDSDDELIYVETFVCFNALPPELIKNSYLGRIMVTQEMTYDEAASQMGINSTSLRTDPSRLGFVRHIDQELGTVVAIDSYWTNCAIPDAELEGLYMDVENINFSGALTYEQVVDLSREAAEELGEEAYASTREPDFELEPDDEDLAAIEQELEALEDGQDEEE